MLNIEPWTKTNSGLIHCWGQEINENKMVLVRGQGMRGALYPILQMDIRTAFLFLKKKRPIMKIFKLGQGTFSTRDRVIRRHIKTVYSCPTEGQESLKKLLCNILLLLNRKQCIELQQLISIVLKTYAFLLRKPPKLVELLHLPKIT